MRRFVDLPAGARKVVTLYIQPDPFQDDVELTYAEPSGTVTAHVAIQALEQVGGQIAVVGDSTGTLRPQLLAASGDAAVPPLPLTVNDIPERPEPLGGLSGMVFAGDSTGLSQAQSRTIERWIGDGGQLIVLGGADWQARTAAFADLLPLSDLAAADATPLDGLAAWAGSSPDALEPATVASGILRDGATALAQADDGSVLASYRDLGAGRVILVGADTATDAFRDWDGAGSLWRRILPATGISDGFFGPGNDHSSMLTALGTIPTLQVPPVELLLIVILGYIVLIGPASYLVLRRVDRRELAWVTAPLLIVLFTAGSYGIGRALKGADVFTNQIAVIRTSSAGAATVETYAGIFSPDRTTYDLTVDADALVAPLRAADGSFEGGPQAVGEDVVVDQGQPAHLHGLAIGVFDFQAVSASGIADYAPSLEVTWRVDGDDIVGHVTNVSESAISDVAYVDASLGRRIGDLDPGASAEFRIPPANFNGSSAAEQVYGFGDGNLSTVDQRQTAVRRSVIESLVGFAGDVRFGPAQGPFLIGWRDGIGPMPLTIDGFSDTRRSMASVEVISVRPHVSEGQVAISPLQMAVGLSATDGDVTPSGSSAVTIVDGSAVFDVALPLEASGLRPTAVRVLFATDPSSLAFEPGSSLGAWPPGILAEVRVPSSGEWVALGDLATATAFEVEPESFDAQGLMQIRLSGTGDPNFGLPPIYVSAEVLGTVGE
jgi:hypothetical protein